MELSPEIVALTVGAGGLGAILPYLLKRREIVNQHDLTIQGQLSLRVRELEAVVDKCKEANLTLTKDNAAMFAREVASSEERVRLAAENLALIKRGLRENAALDVRGKSLERQADSHDPEGIVARIEIDAKGIIVDWSPAAEEMFGRTLSEVKGHSIELLYPHEARGEHDTALKMAMEGKGPPLIGGPPRTIETTVVTRYGEEVPVTAIWRTYQREGAQRFAAMFRYRDKGQASDS